jgi:hypothetical protein
MQATNLKSSTFTRLILALICVQSILQTKQITNGQSATQRVNAGRSALVSADYRAADTLFSLAFNQDKGNDTAGFFYAVTTLIKTIDEQSVQNMLDSFGVESFGRNPLSWSADFPVDQQGWPIPPAGMSSQSVLNLLYSDLTQRVSAAIDILVGLSNRDLIILLNAEETGGGVVMVDWADTALIRSGLHLINSLLLTLSGYNTELPLSEIVALRDAMNLNAEQLLNRYPLILKSLPSAKHKQARQHMLSAIEEFQDASAFIKNRTIGAERLFTVGEPDIDMLDEWNQVAAELKLSIQGVKVNPSMIDENFTVKMSQFYTGNFSPRDFAPRFQANEIIPNTFADPTFGGTVEGIDQVFLNEAFEGNLAFSPDPNQSDNTTYAKIDVITRLGQNFLILGWENDSEAAYEIYRSTNINASNWEKAANLSPLNETRRSFALPIHSSLSSQFFYIKKIRN